MEICDYGCGQEAKYKFKNEKWCCNDNISKCPEIIKKIINKDSSIFCTDKNPAFIKTNCRFCSKPVSITNIEKHKKSCYLNPENIKSCPVCNKPIKDYKYNQTCSNKCARNLFPEMYSEFGKNGKNLTYRTICFSNHEKKCIICGEVNVVSVHHYDENHKNDKPENLIPICPTHQVYMHSKFKELITEKVERYREEWIKNKTFEGVA